LGETRRLLIAPDGALNLIPFAALVDEGDRFLIERCDIRYLTSGRDLLRLETSQPSENAPMVMANPSFGRAEIVARVDRNSMDSQPGRPAPTQNDATQIYFQPPPSTGREAFKTPTNHGRLSVKLFWRSASNNESLAGAAQWCGEKLTLLRKEVDL